VLFIILIEQSTIKLIWKHNSPLIVKAIVNKKLNAEVITIPDFKVYCRTIAIKTAWYWPKTDMKTSGYIRPCSYSPLVF
jgi:hypothetical protein